MKRIIVIASILIFAFSSFAFASGAVSVSPNSDLLPLGNGTSVFFEPDGAPLLSQVPETSYIRSYISYNDNGTHYDYYSLLTFDPYNYFALQALSDRFDISINYLLSISQNVNSINNNVSSFMTANHNDITSFKIANHNDITSFQNDFNNITWRTDKDYNIVGASNNLNDAVAGRFNVDLPYAFSPTDIYVVYDMPDYAQNYLAILSAPAFYQAPEIEIYLMNFKVDIPYLYSSQTTSGQLIIYPIPQIYYGSYRDTIIVHYKGGTSRMSISGTQTLRYLTYNDSDYYTVADTINTNHIDNQLNHQNNIIDIFKQLYASDDLIASKQAQQSVEDATLSEFTGNGSASAKVSDITSTKNAQKAVKDSLNTGASASNVSNIVGVNSGFFSFFSQSVSDSVNNPSLSRQTRDINDPDYVPDILSQNEREYWRLINGDNR